MANADPGIGINTAPVKQDDALPAAWYFCIGKERPGVGTELGGPFESKPPGQNFTLAGERHVWGHNGAFTQSSAVAESQVS